jgi:protein-arginine kinase activator protein McsA
MFGRKKFGLGDFDSIFNDLNNILNEPLLVKGKTKVESGSDENGQWTKETFTSVDGSYSVTNIFRNLGPVLNKSQKTEVDEISHLKSQLETSIEEQNFEKAAELRDKIKSLETNKEKILKLQSELKKAVDHQDFEKAIELRDEIKKLS